MTTPYSDLPDHHFWRRSIASAPVHQLDPVVRTRFRIGTDDRIATAGSCFAQHIARRLRSLGDYYLVAEDGAHLPEAERAGRQYGLFSARYGNIYTAAQLWQLWRQAYGEWTPAEAAWQGRDGGWVDPFRPTVETFASPEAVAADRQVHLAAVRTLFETCDILVFTLGLTEGWHARADGAVYPLAPGVAGGSYDPAAHAFVNFTVAEVADSLGRFLEAVKARNPKLRVILTVSPVPLAATFEDRSVLVSTTYSKAVLRVAAETMFRRFDWVDYFPSYEIIAGSPTGGLYYVEDDREVSPLGVAHVMRLFQRYYIEGEAPAPRREALAGTDRTGADVICDEALIEATRS
nr:GSCFA domain-containing protein [Sphingomonas sp. Y57]